MMRRLVVATLMFSMVILGFPLSGGSQGATADQYFQYGNKLYAAKDYANAAKYYQAAVQMNPNNAQAYQVLGNCYLLTNQKAQALAAYEKSLALNPSNPQLAAYVQNLKNQLGAAVPAAQATPAAATPATSTADAGAQALRQGAALFQQKQYAAAIPYFQQATQLSPSDYRANYYLAYAQYMSRDLKNAAVNFYLANQKQPNPGLKSYADRIKASLPPADQQWVDAQVSGGAGTTTVASGKKKPLQFGVRPILGIALAKLKDLNDDADAHTNYANEKGYGLTGQVTKGNIWAGAEPFFKPASNLELALGFGIFPVGSYRYTTSGQTGLADPGYGVVSAGYTNGSIRQEMKINADEVAFTARFYAGNEKTKGFVGVGAGYYATSVKYNRAVVSIDAPAMNDSYSGTFKKSGIGEHVLVGGSFLLSPSVSVEPYILYRLLKLKSYTGAITDKNGVTVDNGTLTLFSGPNGQTAIMAGHGPSGWTGKELEVDLSGVQLGLGVAIHF